MASESPKDGPGDKYIVLVLAGMEHFIAAEYRNRLQKMCDFVRVTVCSPRYLIDTNAKEIKDDGTKSAFGMPCGYGHAAVGKLIVETTATPQDVRAVPYAQALFAFLYAPMNDTYKGGVDISDGPFGAQRFYLQDDKDTQLLGLKALLREPNVTAATWTRAVQLWRRCMSIWGNIDTKQRLKTDMEGRHSLCGQSEAASIGTEAKMKVTYRASCVRDGPHSFKSIDALNLLGGAVKAFNPDWIVNLNKPDAEAVAIINREHVIFAPRDAASCSNASVTDTPTKIHPGSNVQHEQDVSLVNEAHNSKGAVPADGPQDVALLTQMQAPPTLLTLLDPCGGTGTIPTVAAAMMTSVPQVETATSVSDRVSATTHASSAGTRAPTVFAITSEIENVDAGLDSMVQFPTDVVRANAVTLPLRPGCVDVVISDLPFGLKCLKRKALDKLYPRLLKEMARVLHPERGVVVALTAQHGSKLMTHELHHGAWDLVPGVPSCLPVSIGGCRSDIFIARPHPRGERGAHPPPPMSKKERRKAQLATQAMGSGVSVAPNCD